MNKLRLGLAAGALGLLLFVPAGSEAAPDAGLASEDHAQSAQLLPRRQHNFAGITTQSPCRLNTVDPFCGNVTVRMTRDMSRVRRFMIGFEAPCEVPGFFFGNTLFSTNIPATGGRRSRFSRSAEFEAPISADVVAQVEYTVRGRARRGRSGGGTFSTVVLIVDNAGQRVDRCSTAMGFALRALRQRR